MDDRTSIKLSSALNKKEEQLFVILIVTLILNHIHSLFSTSDSRAFKICGFRSLLWEEFDIQFVAQIMLQMQMNMDLLAALCAFFAC